MKKWIFVSAFSIALIAMAGAAMAANTATVEVTASVVGTCRFTGGTTIGFGALPFDATGAALGATAPGTVTFRCTNGASYAITDDDGLWKTGVNANRMKSTTIGTPEYIPYTFTYTPTSGTGAGWGTAATLTLTATVAPGAYTNNTPDVYSDTVTLTINP